MFRRTNDSETVVGLIAHHVRRDIAFGMLAPDVKLKIDELRRTYGGSVHSMREALTLLSVEGLVEATAQRGFRVASATQADLEDITRVRAEVECLGLHWALDNGDVAWEGSLIAAHHALKKAEDQVTLDPLEYALEWDEANRAFHATLIVASGSPRLIEFHQRLYNQSRRFRLASLREGQIDMMASRDDHMALVEAVIARDRDRAVAMLSAHIKRGTGQDG